MPPNRAPESPGRSPEASPHRAHHRSRRAFDRDEALAVALREFWTYGYETTSIASLTKAMGINPPSLYAAFGDKRQLFGEAVRLYRRGHGRQLPDGPDARSAIEEMLHHLAADYTDPSHPPGCLIITAAANCGPGAQEVKAELRALREATKEAIAVRIRRDVEDGRLPAGTDAQALGTFYAAVVQGMNQQACDGASQEALESVAAAAMRAWPRD
ncbi:TetR/AcrR family transcriptional regulator [Streptomyces sp. TRM66268-LWL]|uniref:TetR/AcrR family transcriptional regulator n=1 Tax=Streptomyces polyasparticus TaxID=2767826 RepID=A0ABR7SND3_9ACTN|nr:TetR/AcrR family transcriptional regulator [Streptomyces polyasparticus]MBC9716364.1 TetR/AcrR family transcriptional regulator [Streptomyces polyasparticus]